MFVRFHLVEHISGSIAVGLRRRGIDVTTSTECGLAGADDESQLTFAASTERVIVTQDADFLRHHANGMPHQGIAYCRQGSLTVGAMTRRLMLIHGSLSANVPSPWTLMLGVVALTQQPSRNNIVITMKAMHVSIRQIGNSQGVVIPKPILIQLGLSGEAGADMTVEGDALVLRRPANPERTGWPEAAKKVAECGDDEMVMGEFGNADDKELIW